MFRKRKTGKKYRQGRRRKNGKRYQVARLVFRAWCPCCMVPLDRSKYWGRYVNRIEREAARKEIQNVLHEMDGVTALFLD